MRNCYLTLFMLLSALCFYAQSDSNLLVETNASASLNLCGSPEVLTVTITNSSEAIATNIQFRTDLPTGITLMNSQYSNIGTSTVPIFNIPDIAANTAHDFTYTIVGNCGVVQEFGNTPENETEFEVSNANSISYSLDNGVTNTFAGNSESYNIRFAELEVKVTDNDVNQFTGVLEKDADGTVFTREIQVRNSGLGQLSEYSFFIDLDNKITYNDLSFQGQTLTPTATGISPTNPNFNRYTYTITDFGNGNTFFGQDDVMVFTDNVSMHFGNCGAGLETNYTANWGCADTVCNEGDQEATSSAYLSLIAGRPGISVSRNVIDLGNMCGDEVVIDYMFTNLGAGSSLAESDGMYNIRFTDVYIDNNSAQFSYAIGNAIIDSSDDGTDINVNFGRDDFFTSDPDGPGQGLEDLDKDGHFDDLPVGNTFTFRASFITTWDENKVFSTIERYAWPSIYPQNNECSPSTYSWGQVTYFTFSERSPASVSAPAELKSGDTATLIFNVDRNPPATVPTMFSFGDYLSDFTLPEGYTIDAIRWVPFSGTTETLTIPNAINNNYRVFGGGFRGQYELDVIVGCSDGAPEIADFDWKMYLDACSDITQLELIDVASQTKPVFTSYSSCDGSGGGNNGCSFATDSFNMERNSFGYVEQTLARDGKYYYTQNELSSAQLVSKNDPGIVLNAAYPTDTVLIEAEGRVLASSNSSTYDTLIFEFAFYLPNSNNVEIFKHISNGQTGSITIDGNVIPLANIEPVIEIDATNRITYTYEIPFSFDTSSGKTIVVSDLLLELEGRSELGLGKGVYDLSVLRANFYGKRTGESTLGCSTGSKGTNFQLYVPQSEVFARIGISHYVGCTGLHRLGYIRISSATGGDDFPNEYRPLLLMDNLRTELPSGYRMAGLPYYSSFPDSGTFLNTNDLDSPSIEFSFDNAPVYEADRFISTTYINSTIEPICDDFELISYNRSVPNLKELEYLDLLNSSPSLENTQYPNTVFRVNTPITINPNVTQEGFEDTVDWPVLYCNDGIADIARPWIALELKEDDDKTEFVGAYYLDEDNMEQDLEVIFYGGIDSISAKGMLVKIERIASSTCKTIYPRIRYNNCENDVIQNIDILSSQACLEYPLDDLSTGELADIGTIKDFNLISCQYRLDEQEISLRYKTGNLSWEVSRLESDVDLCEAMPYEVKVVSSKYANVYDTDLTMTLPQGINIEDIANIEYVYDGQTGTVDPASFILDNTISSNEIVIEVSELVTDLLVAQGVAGINAGDNTIPGSRISGKNEITFTMNFVGDCTMDPGVPIRFNLKGTSNCGDNINLAFNRLLPITGITIPDVVLDVIASDFMVCNTQNQVDINLFNNEMDSILDTQELKLTLPQGVAYAGVANGSAIPVQTGNVLTWDVGDINTNRSQSFSIYTTLINYALLELDYRANLVRDGEAVCATDQQSCNIEVSSGFGIDTARQIALPDVMLTPITSLPVCEGNSVLVSANLQGITDYENYDFNWNVTPTAINDNLFTFNLEDPTQLTVTVSPKGNDDSNCRSTASLDVEVYPGAVITANVIEGVSCAGEANGRATISITGEPGTGYLEQLPFTITGVSPSGALTIGQEVPDAELLTIEDLPQGLFTVTFQDGYGCTFEQTLDIPLIANPISNFCTTLLPCGATSGDVEMSFEMGNVHSGLNGTSYTATVKDVQGTETLDFTGSFPDTQTRTLVGVSPQSAYTLEITADNGCSYTRPFTVQTYGLSVAVSFSDDMTVGEDACSRSVIVDVGHNISPCSPLTVQDYEITLGIIDNADEFVGAPQVLTGAAVQTIFDDLEVGRYKINVRPTGITGGQSGEVCEEERIFELTPDVSFTTSLETVDPLCAGEATGSAEVIINGGSGDFTLVWTASGSEDVISTGYTAKNLPAGDYEVMVTDNNGCPRAIPLTFQLVDPEPLEIPFIEDVQTACEAIAGGDGGDVAIGYDTGVAPYSFVWLEMVTTELDDGTSVVSESLVYQETVPEGGTSVYSGITPGNYKVVVTDANGCKTESLLTTVTQPEVPRQYHLSLAWSSKVIEENETEQPGSRAIAPIAATSFRRAISSQVERCIAETQEVAQENVAMVLGDIDRVRDTVNLAYVQGTSDVYHYTLYYYDRAGNLVRTVPPAGVNLATNVDGDVDRVPTDHAYVTGYDYNSISQLQKQNTPDGGTSNFLYNNIGQLLYSQNERQITDAAFSYSIYDDLGRIVEAGEAKLNGKTFPDNFLVNNQADQSIAVALPLEDKMEYIKTTFNDRASVRYGDQKQRYLRNRVSEIYNLDKNGQETHTYYSYDPHGNVEWVICELPGVGRTTVAYAYDLISGNVNEVVFNQGRIDEYHHKYAYDEDNRIVSVKTSKDGHLWDEDARYDYYLHGPLARTEIGEDRIQGLDFTYTIHGWLKGINTPDLARNAYNPDDTNVLGDMVTKHAKDEFGMALGYYQGDFARDGVFDTRLTASNPFVLEHQVNGVSQDLYNGNISTWTSQTAAEAQDKNVTSYLTGNAYRYDQLNRIKQVTTKIFNEAGQRYTPVNGSVNAFESNYSYDGNGNLTTLRRFKDDGQLMDDLTYHYDLSNPNLSNQLTHVDDGAGQVSTEINDLPDQNSGNYRYDAIGQLIRDEGEGLTYVWNTSGKVSEIIPDRTNDTDTQKVHMKFTYDGMGNRIVKQVNRLPYGSNGEGPRINDPEAVETTYYSLDAQGNVMGIYKREDAKQDPEDAADRSYTARFKIAERPVYGSDRIGQDTREEEVFHTLYTFEGDNSYEGVQMEFLDALDDNSYNNVFLAQYNDLELLDTEGNTLLVSGTKFTASEVNTVFSELSYAPDLDARTVTTPVVTDNNVFVLEDADENLLGSGIVIPNYFSADTEKGVMLITSGRAIIPGLELINSDNAEDIDYKAKSVVVPNPANSDEYLVFYRDVAGGLHTATLSTVSGSLEVSSVMDLPFSNYGRHMAVVVDDRARKAYVFATAHTGAVLDGNGSVTTPPRANLVRFTVSGTGPIIADGPVTDSFTDYDVEGNGELQIALDGSSISMYNSIAAPTQWTGVAAAEIRTWPLSSDWLPLRDDLTTVEVGGNMGKGSLLHTGGELYYTRRRQETTTGPLTAEVVRASDGAVLANTWGDLRANGNDRLYQFAQGTDSGSEWDLEGTGAVALDNLPESLGGATGYQAYQPYTIEGTAPAPTNGTVYRHVGEKYYELKDHLGNVRVVVSDRKDLDTGDNTLSAKVVSYNNYYPFGMPQPNRNFDSQEYRYGFQGQEKDSELKGEGLSVNYKYRMHDPRIGRFFATDPIAHEYPWNSPYSFSENRVVDAIELEGKEKYLYIRKQNLGGDVVLKTYGTGDENIIRFIREQIKARTGIYNKGLKWDRTSDFEAFNDESEGINAGTLQLFIDEEYNIEAVFYGQIEDRLRNIAEENLAKAKFKTVVSGGEDVIIGLVGLISVPFEEVGSGGLATAVVIGQTLYSIDELSGGLNKITNPEEYLIKEAKPLKFFITEQTGKAGETIYNIIDVTLGARDLGNIEDWKDVIGAYDTVSDANSALEELNSKNESKGETKSETDDEGSN